MADGHGVAVAEWGVKKMKTKWGACNIEARRIWLNLELAKKSPQCLEYIIVHEVAHLLERNHNGHFGAIMDKHLPHWQSSQAVLNSEPSPTRVGVTNLSLSLGG